MKRIIVGIIGMIFLSSLLYAEQEIKASKEYMEEQVKKNKDLVSSMQDGYNKKINEISNKSTIKNSSDEKNIESDINENYKRFKSVLNGFEDKSFFGKEIDRLYKNKVEKLSDKDAITFIYFVSEDTNYASIKNFITEIGVLKSHFKNINGKIFLNNYPENYEDSIKGNINAILSKNEVIHTKFGTLDIASDGSYIYTIISNQKVSPQTKMSDSITITDISNTPRTIDIKLKSNINGVIKVVDNFNPKGMYRYLKELKEYGINSKDVNVHVHPWAFKDLGLDVVPAHLLTYCNNEDFRYKQCSNKYLVRGNVNLQYFISKVTEEDVYFNKFLYSLQEGTKYAH